MKRAKRARLESAGWSVGDAQAFLALTDPEAQLVEIRARLALALREVRREQEWTQAQLAAALGSSQSRVAKMEAADHSVSIDLMVRALLTTGVSGEKIGGAFRRKRRVRAVGRR